MYLSEEEENYENDVEIKVDVEPEVVPFQP